MKKMLSLVALLSLLNLPLHAQEEIEIPTFFGPVKSIESRSTAFYENDSGETDSLLDSHVYYEFNEQDSIVLVKNHDAGAFIRTITYKRDENNRLIRFVEESELYLHTIGYEYNKDGLAVSIKESEGFYLTSEDNELYEYETACEYNEAGQLVLARYSDNDSGYLGTLELTYHGKNLVAEQLVDADGNVTGTASYVYNDRDQLVSTEIYENGEQTLKQVNTYSTTGALLRSSEFTYDDYNEYEEAIEYDSLRRMTRKEVYRNGRLEKYYINEYFEEGHGITKLFNEEGKFTYSEEMKTDAFGNPVLFDSRYVRTGETYTFEYSYDSYNNWTTCKMYKDQELLQVIRRQIDYYED